MSSGPENLSLDAIFALLADHRRRYALWYLREHGSMRLPDLAEEVARRKYDTTIPELPEEEIKHLYMDLWHTHIPKLADADVVRYNQDRDTVMLGENADRVLRFLPADAPEERDDHTQ